VVSFLHQKLHFHAIFFFYLCFFFSYLRLGFVCFSRDEFISNDILFDYQCLILNIFQLFHIPETLIFFVPQTREVKIGH